MEQTLDHLLAELEHFARENDAGTAERSQRMLNITRDTGEFLAVLVRAASARRVLEIGTSNGYSTLWLADAARAIGGRVTTVEHAAHKSRMARENFRKAGLQEVIELVEDDAGRVLAGFDGAAFDMVFLDSERTLYPQWWQDIRRVLRPGGLLVADNATSHAGQMAPFLAQVRADATFVHCLATIGKGQFMAVRGAE